MADPSALRASRRSTRRLGLVVGEKEEPFSAEKQTVQVYLLPGCADILSS